MKKYLYVLVPIVKWTFNLIAVMLLFGYVVPQINKWIDLGIGWVVSGLIAMLFSYWAFHRQLPTDRQLAVFIAFWVVITFVLDAILGFLAYPSFTYMVIHYEYAAQILFEIFGILLMARVMRRHRAYHEAVEGIDLEEPTV